MPEYTLLCRNCKTEFEKFSWTDVEEDKMICPSCGGEGATVQCAIPWPCESLSDFGCGCGG